MARISEIILASGSETRRRMLEAAGVSFTVIAPGIDENIVKRRAMTRGDSAAACATELAIEKALHVSAQAPGRTVIGADQILVQGDSWFDKPDDPAAARRQLTMLRGKTHQLLSAAILVREGRVIWRCTDTATLTMREWSEEFLDDYLAKCGDPIMGSVGCYHLEAMGAQLFERVDGDYFTILGLPLLPLLAALRELALLRS